MPQMREVEILTMIELAGFTTEQIITCVILAIVLAVIALYTWYLLKVAGSDHE